MSDIQRHSLSPEMHVPALNGRWVLYRDHLADKTAALAAQAEVADSLWEGRLERDLNRLRTQHAQELAEARGEGEPEELKLLRRVHRRINFSNAAGCGHICARCSETWPCETAVIAGISDA